MAFALNLKKQKNIVPFKVEMVKFLKRFEADDRVYIYNDSGVTFAKGGAAVAGLSRYNFGGDFPFHDLLRDAIFALDFEPQLDRILFIFNDSPFDVYQISKMVKIADSVDCEMYFFEINRKPQIEGCTVLPNLEGLSARLYELYKKGGI